MAPGETPTWFCASLRSYCFSSENQWWLWKPIYKVFCYLQNAICWENKDRISGTVQNSRTNSEVITQTDQVTCVRCVELWLKNILGKTNEAQTWDRHSKELERSEDEFCRIIWTEIPNYLDHWTKEFYEFWCSLTNCFQPKAMVMSMETGIVRIGRTKSTSTRFCEWLKQFIYNYFRIELEFTITPFYLGIGICALGILIYFGIKRTKTPRGAKRRQDKEIIRNLQQEIEASRQLNEELQHKLENFWQQNFKTQEEARQINYLYQENQNLQQKINNLQAELQNTKKLCQIKDKQLDGKQKELDEYKKAYHDQLDERREHNRFRKLYNKELTRLQREIAALKQNQTQNTVNNEPSKCIHQEEAEVMENQENEYVTRSLEEITAILKDVQGLNKQIQEFSGCKTDKTYLHLHEMLIRATITLDNIESEGYETIRRKRKEAIQYVQNCMDKLEGNVR